MKLQDTALALSLLALLAAGCDLDPIQVGDDFPGDEDAYDDGGGSSSSSSGSSSGGGSSDGGADDGGADDGGDEPPPVEPPAEDPPPTGLELDAAFGDCAFNMVWTKGQDYNQSTGLDPTQLIDQDVDSLVFDGGTLYSWIFPGIQGGQVSSLTLELLEVDAVTGEAIIGATVENAVQRLELPPLSLDVSQPIVLEDGVVQNPDAFGQATLTSLLDGTEVTYDLSWGLVVGLNGGDNPACTPILEAVYGPLG